MSNRIPFDQIIQDKDFLAASSDVKRQILSYHNEPFARMSLEEQDGVLRQFSPGITDKISQGYQKIRGAVSTGLNMLDITPGARQAAGMPPPGEQYNPLPHSLSQAGAEMALGVPAKGLSVPGIIGGLKRVGMTAAGGEIGGQAEGRPFGEGALMGGGSAFAGEVAGKGAELTRRAVANLTGSLYRKDALGTWASMGEIVKELAPTKNATVEDFRKLMLSGEGRERLFSSLNQSYDAIGGQLKDGKLIVRSLMPNEPSSMLRLARGKPEPRLATPPEEPPYNSPFTIDTVYGSTPFPKHTGPAATGPQPSSGTGSELYGTPAGPGRVVKGPERQPSTLDPGIYGSTPGVSFTEARKELRDLFKKGWGQADTTQMPSPGAMEARERFHALKAEIEAALPPHLAGMFREERGNFRIGMNLIDLVQRVNGQSNRLFKPGARGVDYQSNIMQNYISSNEARLRAKLGDLPAEEELGPEVLDAISKEVFRGAPIGRGDEAKTLGTLFARQKITPTGGVISERLPKLSFTDYVGKPTPFQTRPTAQTLLDLMGIRGAAELLPDK